uniref:X-C motif chemokine receptor 1 n=1 Tax=Anas platyrhynchos TaxID=8839 RepID=A0A8B9SPN8_ANAPL
PRQNSEGTYSDNNYSYGYSINESNVCEMGNYFVFYTHLTTVIYSLAFFLSLLGNTLVLWILFKYENLVSLTNIFIMNLCVSDLIFSCMLPFWVVDQTFGWIFGEFLCKAMNAIFSIGYYSGVFFLTLMTILRYLSVVNPLSTLRSPTQCCGSCGELGCLDWQHFDCGSRGDAHHSARRRGCLSEKCALPVFLGIIIFCYLRILIILLGTRSRRKHRTVKLILIIVMAFFLSWAPYNILSFLLTFPPSTCQYEKDINLAFHISRKIAFSHCCLNPVLYVFVGVKFKSHLIRLCSQCLPCGNSQVSSPRICSQGKFHYEDASIY